MGDHHKRFDYPDSTFDGSYSFQAIWPLALSMAVAVAWSELRDNWMSLEEERVK